MAQAHTEGVLDLLSDADEVTVHDTQVPKGTALPYVVLFVDGGTETANSLDPAPDMSTVRFQLNAAGLTRLSVEIAADLARDAVIGRTPQVDGWRCSPVRQVNARPIQEDRDVTPHLLYAVNEYEFFSVPA